MSQITEKISYAFICLLFVLLAAPMANSHDHGGYLDRDDEEGGWYNDKVLKGRSNPKGYRQNHHKSNDKIIIVREHSNDNYRRYHKNNRHHDHDRVIIIDKREDHKYHKKHKRHHRNKYCKRHHGKKHRKHHRKHHTKYHKHGKKVIIIDDDDYDDDDIIIVERDRDCKRGRGHRSKDKGGYRRPKPPVGSIVLTIPIGSATIRIGMEKVFNHRDVYYRRVKGGYKVIANPYSGTNTRGTSFNWAASHF